MILFTILAIILIGVALVAIACLSIGGTIFTLIFSDLIVCIAVIVFIMWLLRRKKKRRR